MQIDLRAQADSALLEADVCVVGAGAAGQTLARELAQAGKRVLLLEAGGFDFEADVQALGEGENLGMPYYDLVDSRLRFFGGTTNIWGGRATPLDDMDFGHRPWVPHSGWPLDAAALADGYTRAHQLLELGEVEYGEALWQELKLSAPFDRAALDTRFWRFDLEKERFAIKRCQDLLHHPRIQVVTHANVTRIELADHGRSVVALSVSAAPGIHTQVTAQHYVLACGGIENARLLLVSDNVQAQGIGNAHDQVGRYFMEHPHGRLGTVTTRDHGAAYQLWNTMRLRARTSGVPVAPILRAAPQTQERLGLLNTALTLKFQRDPAAGVPGGKRIYQTLKHQLNPTHTNRQLWHITRRLRLWYQQRVREQAERLLVRLPGRALCVMIRAEQAPNPDSRIVLSAQRDALGVRKADLNWQLSAIDKHTVRELAVLVDAELRRTGIGHLDAEAWLEEPGVRWPVDPTVGNHPIGGYHHMGTTRMSHSATTGVVDADCRVHGVENLYIAGSSVFPTGGWANPTLTILALAYRLADHLGRAKSL